MWYCTLPFLCLLIDYWLYCENTYIYVVLIHVTLERCILLLHRRIIPFPILSFYSNESHNSNIMGYFLLQHDFHRTNNDHGTCLLILSATVIICLPLHFPDCHTPFVVHTKRPDTDLIGHRISSWATATTVLLSANHQWTAAYLLISQLLIKAFSVHAFFECTENFWLL